jgi:hypothetical protein
MTLPPPSPHDHLRSRRTYPAIPPEFVPEKSQYNESRRGLVPLGPIDGHEIQPPYPYGGEEMLLCHLSPLSPPLLLLDSLRPTKTKRHTLPKPLYK